MNDASPEARNLETTRSFLAAHPLATFLMRRMAAMVLLGFGITLVAFVLTFLIPGDPVLALMGPTAASNPVLVQRVKQHYGLDRPLPVQYVTYLEHMVHGDLGTSIVTERPVSTDLEEYVPATAELAVSATILAAAFGIVLGTLAAIRRNKPIDQILRVFSLTATSTPAFWLGLLALYVFFFKLGWLPSGGRLDTGVDLPPHVTGMYTVDSLLAGEVGVFFNALQHIVLPAFVLATYNVGLLTRFVRAAVLDVAEADYMNTARAKGLSEFSVLRHLMRAALPPVVTVVGFLFADVMTGTVLIEIIFSWPGIGRYAFHAATALDLSAIMGVVLFVAGIFIVVNLIVDLLYGLIDPRLRVS